VPNGQGGGRRPADLLPHPAHVHRWL